MLLQPATATLSKVTCGIFGGPGSGKSLTAMLLAIGLSKRSGNAPIALVDPEGVKDFLLPVCDAESIPLLTMPRGTFVEMREALKEAEDLKCCAFVVDHYDQIFNELTQAQKQKLGFVGRRLPYPHREELDRIWQEWVRDMRASSLHCLLNGRLSWDYGDDEDEAGDPIKVKLGTKMRGQWDVGYEPDLLIELEAVRQSRKRESITRSKRGQTLHNCYVIKDRYMTLNGLSFSFKDLNAYKAGDYEKVYKCFAPHFDRLAAPTPRGGVSKREADALDVPVVIRSSGELFTPLAGESAFVERGRRATIAAEEVTASLQVLWAGQSEIAKGCRTAALEALFQLRSWSAIQTLAPERLESAALVLRDCEAEVETKQTELPTTRPSVIAWVLAVRDAKRNAGVF